MTRTKIQSETVAPSDCATLHLQSVTTAAGDVGTLRLFALPPVKPLPRLIRTRCHIPLLVLSRAEAWASARGNEDGQTVLRDGKGKRWACILFRGVQQVSDANNDLLASRSIWARSHSALVEAGEVLRNTTVHWSDWRTYDHPSGVRRTIKL